MTTSELHVGGDGSFSCADRTEKLQVLRDVERLLPFFRLLRSAREMGSPPPPNMDQVSRLISHRYTKNIFYYTDIRLQE